MFTIASPGFPSIHHATYNQLRRLVHIYILCILLYEVLHIIAGRYYSNWNASRCRGKRQTPAVFKGTGNVIKLFPLFLITFRECVCGLQRGDVVECEIFPIGVIRNPVI